MSHFDGARVVFIEVLFDLLQNAGSPRIKQAVLKKLISYLEQAIHFVHLVISPIRLYAVPDGLLTCCPFLKSLLRLRVLPPRAFPGSIFSLARASIALSNDLLLMSIGLALDALIQWNDLKIVHSDAIQRLGAHGASLASFADHALQRLLPRRLFSFFRTLTAKGMEHEHLPLLRLWVGVTLLPHVPAAYKTPAHK